MTAKRSPAPPAESSAGSTRGAGRLAGERCEPQPEVLRARIEARILWLRGEKVLLDRDLADLYGVSTKQLNQQVRRNRERFPADFLLEVTWEELDALRSQTVTLDEAGGRGRHRKHPPLAFTEQGVAMLSSVLRSPRAIRVNLEIMRAFVRLRRLVASHAGLARRLEELEKSCDGRFKSVFDALRLLVAGPTQNGRRIGFGP